MCGKSKTPGMVKYAGRLLRLDFLMDYSTVSGSNAMATVV